MISSASFDVTTSQDIEATAKAQLLASPYVAIRKIFCMYDEGMLILRGRLPTFFHKQIAQAVVMRIDGVGQIVNQIEVSG